MTMSNTKKLFIKTWGCQMNVYDSRKMADVLAPMGYKQVDGPEGADMISFGLYLAGTGSAWLDAVSIVVEDNERERAR